MSRHVTWRRRSAGGGDEPLRIMQRAGHSAFETTKICLREAENLSAGFGNVFPALPPDLLDRGFATVSDRDEANEPELLEELVELTGIEPVTSCMPCKRSPN
jgi:hypothetical protein